MPKSVVEKVIPKVSFREPEIHDHYLEDFDDDEVAGNDLVDDYVVEANVERDELIEPAEVVNEENAGVHIDNAWVDLDVANIVPRRQEVCGRTIKSWLQDRTDVF